MKTRVAIAAVVVCAGSLIWNTGAALPSDASTFKDFDVRLQASTSAATALAPVTQSAALLDLKARVGDVQVKQDFVLARPSFVTSTHGFLTGPDGRGMALSKAFLDAQPASDPHRIIKAFLNEHSALFHHNAGILTSARVVRDEVAAKSGLRTTVWEQMVAGVPVFGARLTGHVTRQGELVSVASQFVPNPETAADQGTPNRAALLSNPSVTAFNAITKAAANINVSLSATDFSLVGNPAGLEKKQAVRGPQLFGETYADLTWLAMNENSLRLCWRVIVTAGQPPERYLILVDAQSGDVLLRQSLTFRATPATYNVFTSDSPSPFSPGWPAPTNAQPPLVERTNVTIDALSTLASPDGWVAEGSTPQTVGNNVDAFLDRNYDASPDTARPAATNRVFDFPMDLTNSPPLVYSRASTVQLFYDANLYHDRLYNLGFTEQAGNYQGTNFGRGGLEEDPVICLVQAGADAGEADNSVFYSAPDGFSGYCAMFEFSGPVPRRDGSLDQEVVFHELTHGLSTRLVGAGVGISQLQSRGMGEGWSDFYALCLLSEAADDPDAVYAEGGYASFRLAYPLLSPAFEENYYYGIRRYPYTTDMTNNPLTFKDIDPRRASVHRDVPISPIAGGFDPSEVHNQGEVWCITLWEARANLVKKYGWQIGNELALQLVTDGMKLSPADPTFLEARDAIIQADRIDTAGENYAELWIAFAKRGMGAGAKGPTSDTTTGVREAYDLPLDLLPDGILETRVNPPSDDILFVGETNIVTVRVSDGFGITNATVEASVSTGETLQFLNDGVAPDATGSNSVYTATFIAPSTEGPVSLRIVASAEGLIGVTNIVTYTISVPPPNNNFANAVKVPALGASYQTTDKRADKEEGEPNHAGLESAVRSLWWNYTPTANTNILIDTAGTTFRTVIAVYTNNNLAALKSVGSAIGSSSRLGAYLNVAVRAGTTYHIAIAGFDSGSVGVLDLAISPGLQPDVTAPVVNVSAPADGAAVLTNRVMLSGVATDPGLNPSGIQSISVNVVSSLGSHETTVPLSLTGPANTNWTSIIGLSEGENTIQVSANDYAGNRSDLVTTHLTYRPLDPVNDFFVNAIVIATNSGVSSVNTIDATKEAGEPNHGGSIGGKSAWWNFTPETDGVLHLSTTNSTFDTVMAVYTGSTVSSLSLVAANDDAFAGAPGGYSEISCLVSSNQTYHIAVDGYDGLSGVVFLTYDLAPGRLLRVTVNALPGGSVDPAFLNVASNSTVVLSATPDDNYQFDLWDGDAVSLANPLTLVVRQDMTVTAHFRPVGVSEDFESGGLQHLAWISSGNKPWVVQTNSVGNGIFAAKSGSIADGQSSSLALTGQFRAGSGSFAVRVSSEANFDLLRFFVDAVQIQQWSGNIGWLTFPFDLTAGTHTLEWRYTKDASSAAGLDAAFIDTLILPFSVPTDASTTPQLTLIQQVDGGYFISLAGQTDQQYIVQTSTNLVNWSNLSTSVARGGVIRIPVSLDTARQALFYRAVASP